MPMVSTYEAGLALGEGVACSISLHSFGSLPHFLAFHGSLPQSCFSILCSTRTHEVLFSFYLALPSILRLKFSSGNRLRLLYVFAHLHQTVWVEGRCPVFTDAWSPLGVEPTGGGAHRGPVEGDTGSTSRKLKIKVSPVNKLGEVPDGRSQCQLSSKAGRGRSMSKSSVIPGIHVNTLWREGRSPILS